MERLLAGILLILFSPLLLVLYFIARLTSKGPFIFKQKRWGKDKKPFTIYKIRTMVENAEDLKSKLKSQNEADWPAFKIYNDPRYTKIGRFLAHTSIDEIPQLINIIRGEMSFVGPRPLPIEEALKVPKKYEKRFSVLPGMTSVWIIRGADHSSFKKWMEMDLEYVEKKKLWYDLVILFQTGLMVLRLFISNIKNQISKLHIKHLIFLFISF